MRKLVTAAAVVLAALGGTTIAADKEAPKQVLFKNVKVFNGTEDKLHDVDVLVEGNLIRSVRKGIDAPGATVIDGGGRTLMPGIIEGHGHLALPLALNRLTEEEDMLYIGVRSTAAASFYIDHGFTTVRDAGGPAFGIRKAIEEGHIVGPRVYSSGLFVSQTSGHGDVRRFHDPHPNEMGDKPQFNRHFSHIADGVPEVRRAVREELRKGSVHIKLMAGGGQSSVYDPLHTVQYSVAEMKAAVEAAQDWGTYVTVHAYTDTAVTRSIEAGVKVIEHGHLITEETAKLMAEKGIWLSTQANFADPSQEDGDMVLEQFGAVAYGKFKQVRDGFATAAKHSKEYGVRFVWETDCWGPSLERVPLEWGLRANHFSNHEQLVQATSSNGELLLLTGVLNPYTDGPLGKIAEGAYADIILVDGNPLEDILVLKRRETSTS